ncbi:MAG: DUF924 domain-containing protein [Rubrivivax sp.]|nr:DUF924 domain-containing protein [Rubrivivax sp.]
MAHPCAPILDFWFGAGDAPRPEWFRADPAFDALIGTRFGEFVERALGGELRDWDAAPASALARILLLDQFTRNIYRGTPRAFAGDAQALAAAQALVARGADQALPPLQRWFVYLPFEHAEDAAAQAQSLQLFGALAAAHPPLADALLWAQKHAVVIDRFGRYPHRNLVLGRVSTPAEIEFLRQPGSSF